MHHLIKKILWIKEREIECFVCKGKENTANYNSHCINEVEDY
jgi:hypothetical protein